MSDTTPVLDELNHLKDKARKMGIPLKGNPSIETVRELINEKLGSTPTNDDPLLDRNQRYAAIKREATQLIRCSITCMNPDKRNMKGNIYAAGNKAVGTIKKYIPFSPASHPDGYHVPKILLDMLRSKQYQVIQSSEDERGRIVNTKVLVSEFNIVELPPLTEEELKDLAKSQQAKGGL